MGIVDDNMIMDTLKEMCALMCCCGTVFAVSLPQAGSDRRYYRLTSDGRSFIGVYVPDATEGKCFVKLAEDFKSAGCHVPEVYTVSPDFHFYIEQDLGDVSLFSYLKEKDAENLVKDSLARLVDLQKTQLDLWVNDCMSSRFCMRQVMWDLNYFKYEYVKPANVIFNEDLLEDDFEKLAHNLISIDPSFWGFMMRDCQSRNIMLTSDGPVFIDFQGGRFGPSLYDAVSLLWQARASFTTEFRKSMLDFYSSIYCNGDSVLKMAMLSSLNDLVLFRTLQVLGAYGFRGLVQHRAHFLLSIPAALSNLKELLDSGAIDNYPELKNVSVKIIADFKIQEHASESGLTVEIFSFSYKKGYPRDMSGNGGGFMFDCRAMNNPGRYTEYKSLTGRDQAVMDFLENKGEVIHFLRNAWSMTDVAIERYLSRGFSHLQIGFGCTGGQHRSEYCAEQTARHVELLFPDVNVILTHREHPAKIS